MITRSDDLEILLSVIDANGFSNAANILGIDVSRVSRSVNKIEKQLKITIINRTTRKFTITEEGIRFIDSIRKGIEIISRAESCAQDGLYPSGKLRIDGASPFIFHQIIPLLSEFSELYPDIKLEITSNEGFIDLLEKKIDIAIRIGALEDSTLHASKLGQSKLHLVASPKYLAAKGEPKLVSELKNHKLIGFSNSKSLNIWPVKGLDIIQPHIKASNGEIIRQLTLQHHGISCLSGFMINDDIKNKKLISLLETQMIRGVGRENIYAVYYQGSSLSKRISTFVDFIKSRLTL